MPCDGVDEQDHALARGEGAADLVAEVDVAGRVDEVDDVAVPFEAHVLRLDGDAALALEVHRVEVLGSHVARVDRARQLQEAVGERRLPVIDVGDDAEAANAVECSHDPSIVAYPRLLPGTHYFSVVSRRVVVVGSANVDLVWHGERLPAPGETVTDGEFVEVLGGKGANQAAAAAALGADVSFVGCVGADEHGRAVRADLEARGIDCSALATGTGAPTGVAVITVDARGRTRSRSRPARTASSRPTAWRVSSGPATSCCARSRSRSKPSKPRSRAPARVAGSRS